VLTNAIKYHPVEELLTTSVILFWFIGRIDYLGKYHNWYH